MVLEKKPFVKYKLDEEKDNRRNVITVSLNAEELEQLRKDKRIIRQPKDSTALKQLALLGSNVVNSELQGIILELALNNERRNRRVGLEDFDQM